MQIINYVMGVKLQGFKYNEWRVTKATIWYRTILDPTIGFAYFQPFVCL